MSSFANLFQAFQEDHRDNEETLSGETFLAARCVLGQEMSADDPFIFTQCRTPWHAWHAWAATISEHKV